MGLSSRLRRNQKLVAFVRRLGIPDYIEPARRLVYGAHVIEKMVGGQHFKMLIDNPMSEEWYESAETAHNTRFFQDHLVKTGDVVADVGAHNGLYALIASLTVGCGGRVHAFEPLPSNYSTLLRNLELNEIVNVCPHNLALGASSGRARFNEYNDGMITDHGRLEVDVRSLSEVVETPVDVLKVDVEGAECEVLEGAMERIGESTRVMCEVHPERLDFFGRSTADVLRIMKSLGGSVWQWDEAQRRPVPFEEASGLEKRCFLYRMPADWE